MCSFNKTTKGKTRNDGKDSVLGERGEETHRIYMQDQESRATTLPRINENENFARR